MTGSGNVRDHRHPVGVPVGNGTLDVADLAGADGAGRTELIVATLTDAFESLMRADPGAFRVKFRKMAADASAFYRGSACLFYADVARLADPWVDGRGSRVWIQGDLHAENFGTYLDSDGRLVFDVNDFDEAYLGHWTWDVQRFAAAWRCCAGRRPSRTPPSTTWSSVTSAATSTRSGTTCRSTTTRGGP
jgi:Uncharacterized protein conserved in bacteria (DUF2252)